MLCFLQLKDPHVVLEDCRRMLSQCRDPFGSRGCFVGIFDIRGYANGIFRAIATTSPDKARSLVIQDLVVSDMIARILASGLVAAIENYALSLGCDNLTLLTENAGGSGDLSASHAFFAEFRNKLDFSVIRRN